MRQDDSKVPVGAYLEEVAEKLRSGHALEHAYRPALQRLIESAEDTIAVNDPKHSEHGAPDFVFLRRTNSNVIKGYAEAKDLDKSLDKAEQSDQMLRYTGYANLFLTNYVEFRFYSNGEKYQTIQLADVENGQLKTKPENVALLWDELQAFLTLPPEPIKSGRRLAEIMGAKARRIRTNVLSYLTADADQNRDLHKIYQLMKKMLVHDLDPNKFADMYSQTLVYGLFVARYGDNTPKDFSRGEARDLVPRTNPFLREFFDHIAGTGFDDRLAKIVDELCQVFSASDVREIVQRHLRILHDGGSGRDPIIHFYEDFLHTYDPNQRKRMGAYYTPTPVVRFIVRNLDAILKNDFGIAGGLASNEKVQHQVDIGQDTRRDRRLRRDTSVTRTSQKVQILDPAVGTGTFLNEVIKHIHSGFRGQEGRWPAYVRDSLVQRVYGFELMMAPYTIAHLKLGMTLSETGVGSLPERLNLFLTNTLEEGVPTQPDLFTFGLADAVSEESRLAAEVKHEKPVMVVVGNPPYSGVSANETSFANGLVKKYKVEPGGLTLLKEKKHWLNDDYVKFLAFAEDMIAKNGSGVVGMITNNGYLDNPTFRGMRWHLMKTFDKIYVLDLHGSANKQETAPDGGKDENVFDIMQGVGIILAVKTGKKKASELAQVLHAEIYGSRSAKFKLLEDEPTWEEVELTAGHYLKPTGLSDSKEYLEGIPIDELFLLGGLGIVSGRDRLAIDFESKVLEARVKEFEGLEPEEARTRFELGKDSSTWKIGWAQQDLRDHGQETSPRLIQFRPFDYRYCYYMSTSSGFIVRPNVRVMQHFLNSEQTNIGLVTTRFQKDHPGAFITEHPVTHKVFNSYDSNSVFPLWLYHPDGSRTTNLNPAQVKRLTRVFETPPEPDDILNYVYAVLHSPSYRERFKEFMKVGFPRIPAPASTKEFARLVALGAELRKLHLLTSPLLDDTGTTYPKTGSDMVDTVTYAEERININRDQYFGNVPKSAWDFWVGGYQPARKWLNERKGRKLTDDDLVQYQRILKALLETQRIMADIG